MARYTELRWLNRFFVAPLVAFALAGAMWRSAPGFAELSSAPG